MKSKLLALLTLLMISSAWLYAAESEPNNSKNEATKLNLNQSNTGAIGIAGDVDWWHVTTTSDGKLDVTLAVSNGLYCYYQLYDNNGTTLLFSDYTNGTETHSFDGLSPGKYYIYIYAFTAGQLPVYTISNALIVAPLTIDTEPNGSYTQANELPLNGSSTGHVGYYYNGIRDTTDWWKVTTLGNGELEMTLVSNQGKHVYYSLYDGNGTTLLHSDYTNGTETYGVDGLAAGTYYVKVYCFYNHEFTPYTLTSAFIVPPVANDAEPNNTKGQAKTLQLNNKKTGQVGYYYNGVRDTADWYKLTTDGDGDLELTIKSENGEYVYVSLYDKDGTTLLNSDYTNGTYAQNTLGLAEGIYYLRIYCFYNHKWADYTISDTLTAAPVANDDEANNTIDDAISFVPNSTLTGHVGYYYDQERDTADWYQIVTSEDGQIALTIDPAITEYVYATLYDENGTTVLASNYSNSSIVVSADGLAAGTYYVRVYCYYNYKYSPYTLTNVLNTYVNDNDGFNNDDPKKAVTLGANNATEGHVGFRFNGGERDVRDWWKINYTGNSDMTVTLNWEPRICCGNQYVYLKVYADTAASPIYNQYNNTGNVTANFTGLEKQYYYVQVVTYYNTEWAAYNLTPTFTQKDKAKITLQSSVVGTDCANGSIDYKCTKSSKPYTVQLFRFGKKYGDPITIKSTKVFTIGSLPPGTYYATVFGDGATGQAKGTSATTTIVPVPTGLSTTKIKATKATLNWDTLACIDYDSVYYRVQGSGTWTKKETGTNNSGYLIEGLTASTTYEWKVAHVVDTLNETATSSYSGIVTFITSAAKIGDEMSATGDLAVYPNPATSTTTLNFRNDTGGEITLKLFDAIGHSIESWTLESADGAYTHEMDLSTLAAGVYYIRVMSEETDQTVKIVKQ